MAQLLAHLAVAAFVAVHLFIARIRHLSRVPRSRWLSAAGGVAVAYVFLHMLPELHRGRRVLARASPALAFAEHHVYLVALGGRAAFYGLERLAVSSRRREGGGGARAGTSAGYSGRAWAGGSMTRCSRCWWPFCRAPSS